VIRDLWSNAFVRFRFLLLSDENACDTHYSPFCIYITDIQWQAAGLSLEEKKPPHQPTRGA
jgi:hypothetical protein